MPARLGAAAKREWDSSLVRLEAAGMDTVLHVEAVEVFVCAVDQLERMRRAYQREGRPLVSEAPNGIVFPHPMVKMLREQEAHVSKLGKSLLADPASARAAAPRVTGRPTGDAPLLPATARARLRAV